MKKFGNLSIRLCVISAFVSVLAAHVSCAKDPVEVPGNEPEEPDIPIIQDTSVVLLSGPISAYYYNDTARIRIRTAPWNLLENKKAALYVTDTLGLKSKDCHITDIRLCPDDSTWLVGARLDDVSSSDVRLRIDINGNVLMTQVFTVMQQESSIQLLSGPVSAYVSNDTAHIRIRTAPWNLLHDSISALHVTDTLGVESKTCYITGMNFCPEDSTWLVGAKLKTGTSNIVRLCLNMGENTLMTDVFAVKRITDSMPTIKAGGKTLTRSNYDYSGLLPTVTDFSRISVTVSSSWDSVTVGDIRLSTKAVELDLSEPVEACAWKYDVCKKLTVSVRNTGLPVVRITTPSAINSKKVWVSDCKIRIELPDGTVDLEDTLSMRGRGNNTWNFAKKPYALRMNGRTKVLGMPKHKRWILLANYKDRTLMRNDAVFWLSRHSGLNYTISGQFVELVMNGKHVGNYYLCEQAKIDKNRIAISEPDANNPESSGYMVEIDTYYDDDLQELKNSGASTKYFGFKSKSFNLPYQFKQPDMEEMTQEAYDYFKNYINDFEATLKSDSKLKNHEYEKYLDVDQAIDFVLVEELAGNHDFYNTWPVAGPHSTYLYLDAGNPDGRLCFGPGWDFDYHTFMPSRSSGWIGLTAHKEEQQQGWGWGWGWTTPNDDYYFYFLLKDSKFKNRLKERWNAQKDTFKQLTEYIDSMAVVLRDSESANYAVWGTINNPNGDENEDQTLSFQNAINRMKDGFLQRWKWMDENIPKL